MLKIIVTVTLTFVSFFSFAAKATEIQCSVYNAFGKYQAELLFEYNQTGKKSLTLKNTKSIDLTFDNHHPGSDIIEVLKKSAINLSTDPNIIWVKHPGQYNWEFKINRSSGEILINQTWLSMSWYGDCRKIDRSNKF